MLKKNRETFYASLNDYLTVESIKSNICQENEISIRANGEFLKPGCAKRIIDVTGTNITTLKIDLTRYARF